MKENTMGIKKKSFIYILIILALSLFIFVSCVSVSENYNESVKIILRGTDGLTILSDQILDVKPGKEATFEIKIADDYVYLGNNANAYYNPTRGLLVLSRIRYSTTIDLQIYHKSELTNITAKSNIANTITFKQGAEWVLKGDTVVLTAKNINGWTFEGWSIFNFLANDGVLVSNETEYQLPTTNTDTYQIFANYSNPDPGANPDPGDPVDPGDPDIEPNPNPGGYAIRYHANGGSIAGSSSTTYTQKGAWSSYFKMQNTLYSNGTFVRNGYVAIGYSTDKNANFETAETVNDMQNFSNMGGVCIVPKDIGVLDLYVVWAKETAASEFTYAQQSDNSIKITSYKGNASVVVIPEKINGYPVTTIANGAFNYKTNLTKLVIPRTVTTLELNAFINCGKVINSVRGIKEVVFFDSIIYLEEFSFNGTGMSNVVLNSQRLPRHAGSVEGSFCIKYMNVVTSEKKNLIILSGSSSLYGFDSLTVQVQYPAYNVINYGTNAGVSSLFYLQAIANHTKTGDIIIHAPEYGGTTTGDNVITGRLFRGNEQCYDILREVNMLDYTNFWKGWKEFQQELSKNMGGKAYQSPCSGMNAYGDINQTATSPNFTVSPTNTVLEKPENTLTAVRAARLNSVNAKIKASGGKLLMSFAPIDRGYLKPSTLQQSVYDNFRRHYENMLYYDVISDPGVYIIDHSLFFNSNYHPNVTGRNIRTANLLKDMRAYIP